MRKLIVALLLGAVGLAAFAGFSQAGGLIIRAPFVQVQVAPSGGVVVGAPGVQVQTPPRGVAVPAPSGVVVSQPVPAVRADGAPPPLPTPTVITPIPVDQFAKAFQPRAGQYEVVFVHTKTCQPVKVCFTLPDGCPRQVRVTKHVLEFDYGRTSVRIRFLLNGEVKVLS